MLLKRFWLSFIAYFYPDESAKSDYEFNRHIQMGITFCWVGAIFLLANAAKWIRFEAYHIATAGLVLAALLILMSFLFKFRVLSIFFVNHVVILSLFLDFYFLIFFSGGVDSKQMFWLMLIPLFAQLLLTGHWGSIWFGVVFVFTGVLFAMGKSGYSFPTVELMTSNDQFVGWAMAVFGGMLSLFIASTIFKGGILGSVNLATEAKDNAETISSNLNSIIKQIEKSSSQLNTSSSDLLDTSKKLEEDTQLYFDKTSNIYDSSKSIKQKMDTISAEIKQATERMEDISRTASKARKIAEEGNQIAKVTSKSMIDLKRGGEESVNITNLIQQTSKQLKLLSLNAAIEAANAGEHGQGFAIVANQVKTLAERTSEATAEVSDINQNIQATTDVSAEYISKIVEIIQDIYELQQTISSAVEKQNEDTKTISKGLAETVEISTFITNSINEVVSATERTQGEVQKNFSEAKGLATMSESLTRLVSFRDR